MNMKVAAAVIAKITQIAFNEIKLNVRPELVFTAFS